MCLASAELPFRSHRLVGLAGGAPGKTLPRQRAFHGSFLEVRRRDGDQADADRKTEAVLHRAKPEIDSPIPPMPRFILILREAAMQDALVEERSRHAEKIPVANRQGTEGRLFQGFAQRLRVVSTQRLTIRAGPGFLRRRMRAHPNDELPFRLEDAMQFLEHADVIVQHLQHVEAHDVRDVPRRKPDGLALQIGAQDLDVQIALASQLKKPVRLAGVLLQDVDLPPSPARGQLEPQLVSSQNDGGALGQKRPQISRQIPIAGGRLTEGFNGRGHGSI